MEAASSESLKQQFQNLQDEQQKKLLRRKKLQEERRSKSLANENQGPASFGVDDDLELKLSDPSNEKSYLSEELVDHLNNQIRELKDENGRLYKLLSERDFEIRQLRKKKEAEKVTPTGITNETAATKIVELSKKVRELTAELEGEKTKGKQLGKKCQDLQNKLSQTSLGGDGRDRKPGSGVTARTQTAEEQAAEESECKVLQDKLRLAESKVTEFRNQCLTLRQELKVAQKVLNQEIGDNVNIQSLLSGNSNWRGRAQQILTLQKKVSELKSKVEAPTPDELSLEDEMMGSRSFRKPSADDRHKEQLRRLEKERKEAQERAAADFQALEADHSSIKQKLDASKARNKVLSNEVKALKQQKQTLLDKGHHDDELITALMQQLHQLKSVLEDRNKDQKEKGDRQQEQLKELAMRTQYDNNIVEQLKAIVSEKEAKVRGLEEEINQLKLSHIQRSQLDAVGALFEQSEGMLEGAPETIHCATDMTVQSITPPRSRMSERALSSLSQTSHQETSRAASRKSNRPLSHRPPSASSVADRYPLVELQKECHEYRTLSQVAAVERDKLAELVQVLQKRLEESSQQLTESQSELIQQKKKSVQLEKQLGRANLRLEQNTNNKTVTKKRSGHKLVSSSGVNNLDEPDPVLDDSGLEELHVSLSIQRDENEALKAALQSTLKAKEEDLRMYTEMMEETKKVFLQALRQHNE